MRHVVDASVARAAGVGTSDHPPSPECVAALAAMLEGGAVVVLFADWKAEWKKHARPYAVKWLSTMLGRKRFFVVRDEWDGVLLVENAADEVLGSAQALAVRKDLHLVSAAMLTDRRVLSLDTTQRKLLIRLLDHVPALRALQWGVPDGGRCCLWVSTGATDYLLDDG